MVFTWNKRINSIQENFVKSKGASESMTRMNNEGFRGIEQDNPRSGETPSITKKIFYDYSDDSSSPRPFGSKSFEILTYKKSRFDSK